MATKWKSFDHDNDTEWMTIPAVPACYVIYLDGQLGYIGQTTDLKKRLNDGHSINWARYSSRVENPWTRNCSHLLVKAHFGTMYGDWAMRELRLIRRLQPPHNRRGNLTAIPKPRERKKSTEPRQRRRVFAG